MSKILRVNMSDLTAKYDEVPARYAQMAGRWLTSTLISDEVPPDAHPLGPSNKLVFSPGIITGSSAPTSARLSVGGKSPLTGGIKEANAGTGWAPSSRSWASRPSWWKECRMWQASSGACTSRRTGPAFFPADE